MLWCGSSPVAEELKNYQLYDVKDELDVAIKKLFLSLPNTSESGLKDIKREINILKNLRNRYIIQYYGLYSDDQELFIIMDYAENGTLTKIIHRDLKSMNILLDKHLQVKISDFGLSRTKNISSSQSTHGIVGTLRKETIPDNAPEVGNDKKNSQLLDLQNLPLQNPETNEQTYSSEDLDFDINSQSSNKNPNPGNIQYLPNHVEAQQKINEIKTAKDEKIALVNSKCGFPSLKSVPNNQQTLKPELESYKFKPVFATQKNYQMLDMAVKGQVNNSLSLTCSQFAYLSTVKELNSLINEYLGEIFKAKIFGEVIYDELGEQLNISNHSKYELQPSGNNSVNHN
ncbi:14672_t:CDS:2 [Ambispora leptoticha]|uniref:14672_t:CDS:1 n=1 Tax=Ambispora leptoticha TaxID=144679 RepID=A0A9N8W6K9_9GLOM|nr:14672_t:CDS:2 [Ambispora leptoticha]